MVISWFIQKAFMKSLFKYDVYVKKTELNQLNEFFKGYNQDYMTNRYNRKPVYENVLGMYGERSGHFSNKTGYFTECLNCHNTNDPSTRGYCKQSSTKWCPLSHNTFTFV